MALETCPKKAEETLAWRGFAKAYSRSKCFEQGRGRGSDGLSDVSAHVALLEGKEPNGQFRLDNLLSVAVLFRWVGENPRAGAKWDEFRLLLRVPGGCISQEPSLEGGNSGHTRKDFALFVALGFRASWCKRRQVGEGDKALPPPHPVPPAMSPIDEKLPESIDLTHHLSAFSRARPLSPLKGLQKYWGKPGIISLAGGLPSPDVFPFSSVGADILLPNAFPSQTEPSKTPLSWLWNIFSSGKPKTVPIEIPRHASTPGQLDLATVLQYSMASGQPKLLDFARELTGKVFRPGYSDWTVLAHVGNTDGWMKAVLTLCNPGEGVLTSTWTYPSALACMLPYNIKAVPVDMDGQGMRADALREVLANWDAEARGMPRPHVMYTVPVGQNPTGATMALGRKKEIYDVCVEFDVIIVEDDPYYFLQEGPYHPASHPTRNERKGELDLQAYIDHLAPSYLRIDYEGRVIRLDTFSKTIAPGCRMGWFTCNPKFGERLERQAETSTQAPCGFSQALIILLVEQWGFEGFLRWTQGLQTQYTVRRDFIIDCLADEFDLRVGVVANSGVDCFTGCDVYTAYPKVKSTRIFEEKKLFNDQELLSFVPPTSGMFVWLKLNLEQHPQYGSKSAKELEWDLWVELAEAGVLFGPGQMFAATATVEDEEPAGHFRVSFSNAEFNTMKKAISIFARVIVKFFRA